MREGVSRESGDDRKQIVAWREERQEYKQKGRKIKKESKVEGELRRDKRQ